MKRFLFYSVTNKQTVSEVRHIIVCGVGKTGYQVLNELVRSNRTCVALDTDTKRIELVKENIGEKVTAIVGDGTQDDDLLDVGVERASGCWVS